MSSPVNGISEQESATSLEVEAKAVSPRRLYLVTVAVVLISELAIMMCIEVFLDLSPHWEAIADASALTVFIIPLLFVTLYSPLQQYVREVRRTGEELRYSESKYSTVVENSPAGVFIYRDGRFVFANPKLVEIYGRPLEELLQVDPVELVAPEYREQLRTRVKNEISGIPIEEEVELQILTPEGQERWVNGRTTTIRYRGADSILGLVQDVTRRKQLEQELRRLSSQRLADQEAERAHLARELHDGIGQSLSGIKFLIEHTVGQAYPDERREQVAALRALIPKIQDTVDEVRRMSMALRPSTLDDLGLLSTITWFLRQLQNSCPHLQVEHDLSVQESNIPEPLKIVIYRTLQEALNNAAKHCGECTVRVALEQRDGLLCLTVADDGGGFDLEEVHARDATNRGFGLGSMRERVELSEGTFELQAEPGKGVTVHANWRMSDPVNES